MEKIDDCLREIQYIGLRIAYFRKLRNLTQADLAEKQLDIPEHTINLACPSCHQRLTIVHGNDKLKVIKVILARFLRKIFSLAFRPQSLEIIL